MEASAMALWACLPETHGALMYPLQLRTSNVPLATILGIPATTQPQAVAGKELTSTASIPQCIGDASISNGCKITFDQGVPTPRQEETVELDDTPEEPPCCTWKEGRSVVRPIKQNHQEAFSKESELIWMARWDYYKTHWPNYEHEQPLFYLQGNGYLW